MRSGLRQPWLQGVGAIHCSNEQKANDAAHIVGEHLHVAWTEVDDLGGNDRSATGFLPPAEFEQVAKVFFAEPTRSVGGWECGKQRTPRRINGQRHGEPVFMGEVGRGWHLDAHARSPTGHAAKGARLG